MSDSVFLSVAVNVPLSRLFDYLPRRGERLPPIGSRVRVPFGSRQQVGVVLNHADKTDMPRHKIREISAVLDEEALLGVSDLDLIRFASEYYHHPIGEVVAAALPALLRQGQALHPDSSMIAITNAGRSVDHEALMKRAPRQAELLQTLIDNDETETDLLTQMLPNWRRASKRLLEQGLIEQFNVRAEEFDDRVVSESLPGPALNEDQHRALEDLRASDTFSVCLLDGVTGSGKTEVYLRRIQDVIDADKQVLVLVPEIGLTPQLVDRLRNRLAVEPALLHSRLSNNDRLAAWRAARNGAARLVVGTRSAVFTPCRSLGLIVIDEEHDQSLKQQEGLRYSARDLAITRASQLNIPIVLGSATPTLEMLQHCRSGSYRHVRLPVRAGNAQPPAIRLVDTIRAQANDGISEPLADSISRHLDANGQVLLYLNRRGFAPTLICSGCGQVAECMRCDSRMTVHARSNALRCHHCGAGRALINQCAECGQAMAPLGEGTERLEDALRKRFPDRVVQRIDSDSTQRRGSIDEALKAAASGQAEILVGTQMLSKGHHFPNLTLVGIVNADQGLFGTDFRSGERLAQSIVQVAGRAGRESTAGEVLIQTAFVDHPFWATLIDGGYAQIADAALAERESTRWPPFTRLALVRAAGHKKADAHRFLQTAKRLVDSENVQSTRVFGPVDAPMARKAGRYRAQLLLQGSDRKQLHAVLRSLRVALEREPSGRKVRWSIDVDPIELF